MLAAARPPFGVGIATGAAIHDDDGARPMVPASNMKVISTGAALALLGPDFRFSTRLLRDGDRLTVVGDGDPSFGDEAMVPFVPGKPANATALVDDLAVLEPLTEGWLKHALRRARDSCRREPRRRVGRPLDEAASTVWALLAVADAR